MLGGPGDQPGRGAHEGDRRADRPGPEERRLGEPAAGAVGDAESPGDSGPALVHHATSTGAGSSTTRSASAASAGR